MGGAGESPGSHGMVITITGLVQGVGFRPTVARVAARHGLRGWVRNDGRGVTIRLQCGLAAAQAFAAALRAGAPAAARIDSLAIAPAGSGADPLPPVTEDAFVILHSPHEDAAPLAAVTPDLALCDDCRRELLDPADRRHRYPFINCTNCGPRYSIIRALPYDRERTTMAAFTMCPACAAEYADPLDRRYHAQPNACPDCGPAISALDAAGRLLGSGEAALAAVLEALRAGRIAAVKGLGGFHLFADAIRADTVRELRARKHRDEKPFAVMFRSMDDLLSHAQAGPQERRLLQSPAAPVVLVRRLPDSAIAAGVAPGNPWIGALLPYTPLHVLLMLEAPAPMVATSANISEEPLCTDNDEALRRLGGIADVFLVHDRPVARAVDDSVARVAASGPILLRRARGHAPDPLPLPEDCVVERPLLAVGGHLKNTVALALPGKVVVSPHIGDLSNAAAIGHFRRTLDLLAGLYGGGPGAVACDLHPDYASTRHAQSAGLPVVPVQHHLAHVLACLLEHGGGPQRVLGVAWDGTGYGDDGTIWGGEFIVVDRAARTARRVAHLRRFRLPGGEHAARQTARSALGILHAAGLLESPACAETLRRTPGPAAARDPLLMRALERGVNCPLTSSAGRLFDAVAALLGLAGENRFEGQGGMAVEIAATGSADAAGPLPWSLAACADTGCLELDWAPAIEALCAAARRGGDPAALARRFHRTLADMIAGTARACGVEAVALTGGCFQNALLTDLTREALAAQGFRVLLHRLLPPNDNAVAAGQALGALWGITRTSAARS